MTLPVCDCILGLLASILGTGQYSFVYRSDSATFCLLYCLAVVPLDAGWLSFRLLLSKAGLTCVRLLTEQSCCNCDAVLTCRCQLT